MAGTSSGLGRRLVTAALARGDKVIATARNLDKLADLPESDNLHVLQLDVTDSFAAIKKTVDTGVAVWGRIDVVVNNAGTIMGGLLEEIRSDGLKEQFDTNVFGLLNVTNAVLPHMRARRSGTVCADGLALELARGSTGLYASSKAVVRILAETLSSELAPFSIRTLVVEPAAFRTEGVLPPFYTGNPIAGYDDLRAACIRTREAVKGTQRGDPAKAMEVLVDVVRGEGKAHPSNPAHSSSWPLYLPLGDDADRDIRSKCGTIVNVLDEWKDCILGLNFDEPEDNALVARKETGEVGKVGLVAA